MDKIPDPAAGRNHREKRYENGTYVDKRLETKDVVFNNTTITHAGDGTCRKADTAEE